MRDPNRIAVVLNELGKYWMSNPDLRLGQIVCNANRTSRANRELPPNDDVFYLEDDEFLRSIDG